MMSGAATAVGSMATKKVLSKSAKEKAEEKRKAELKAKQEIQAEGKRIEKTKDALRVAGLAPGVGAAGDAAAGAITLAQRAKAKDPKRKKELNKELAGDAAALVPAAGQVTRSAQLAAKAGKAVRGTKRTGKLAKVRGRAGAAIRKHGDTAVEKGVKAAASHLRKKSMEDHTEMNYTNAYVKKLMESKPSREVVETPGRKMTVARSRITGGQYQKSHGDTEGSKKSGKEAAKMISQARRERLARQGMVPPRVGGRTRRGMRDHTEYDQKGQGIAEAGPKGKIEAAYGQTPHGKEQYKKLSSRPNDPSPVERARMRREAAAENKRFRTTSMKDHTEYQRIGALMAEAMGLFETQYRGRSFIPKKPDTKDSGLPRTVGTPSEGNPEAAAAGKKRAEQRRAELKAHMAKKSEEARAERAKRAAGQTLDPYTGKPKK